MPSLNQDHIKATGEISRGFPKSLELILKTGGTVFIHGCEIVDRKLPVLARPIVYLIQPNGVLVVNAPYTNLKEGEHVLIGTPKGETYGQAYITKRDGDLVYIAMLSPNEISV